MKQKAIVWRSLIYHSAFICNCGNDLMANDKTVLKENWLYCRKCGLRVAKIEEIEVTEELAPGKYGDYIEFQRRKRMS